ncbi:hypothetical protein SALB1_0235 [Salinisphaera sp. LB1]|nr:hypothetical protein SALB1_0235 [Salinisphaera sp. LB1]
MLSGLMPGTRDGRVASPCAGRQTGLRPSRPARGHRLPRAGAKRRFR